MDTVIKSKFKDINAINAIVAMAERDLHELTGVKYRLLLVSDVKADYEYKALATIVANALGMGYDAFGDRSRRRRWVDLRHLTAYFLKEYFPEITLREIQHITGHGDHTSVINCIRVAKGWIETRDAAFYAKYENCLQAITQGLN